MDKYSIEVVISTNNDTKYLADVHVHENGEITMSGKDKPITYEPKYIIVALQAIEQIKTRLDTLGKQEDAA